MINKSERFTTIYRIVSWVNISVLMAWIINSDYKSENWEASTQLTVLPLEWGVEWARERASGSSTASISMPLEWSVEWVRDIDSNPMACISMPLEWACDMGSNPTASISMPLEWAQRMDPHCRSQSNGKYQYASWVECLQHAWDVQPGW